jgi:ABC-type transport system involved in multi-copper enzyme maturation permease subunit
MGRLDYVSVLLRLIGTELYRLRRRMLSKVLLAIAIGLTLLVFGLISLVTLFAVLTPAKTFYCSNARLGNNSQDIQNCVNQPFTPAEQVQANNYKQSTLKTISSPLRLPGSVNASAQIARTVGSLLTIILTAIIVGSEYANGTIRLLFTRGPTRTQFLLAKVGAVLFCITIGFLIMFILGILVGAPLNLISGIGVDFSFFSTAWIGHLVIFALEGILGLCVYAMMTLFLATLGRSTAAGLAGALVWSLLEPVVGAGLSLLGNTMNNGPGDFFKAIPDYMIGNNISALTNNQAQYLQSAAPSTSLTDMHALLVLTVYLVLFVGLAWLTSERRDVIN